MNEHFAMMFAVGKWNDVRSSQRAGATMCLKPHVPKDPVESVSMFQNVDWIWSSMDSPTNNVMTSNENLIIQMASSGFYGCKNGCSHPMESPDILLQNQLNNAPASFHGNIVKFQTGQYYYMCTRNNNFSNRAQKGNLLIEN
jgi:hypothetical protein